MSNRQSRERKRELRGKILEANKNEKKRLFYKLINWFNKKIKPEREFS